MEIIIRVCPSLGDCMLSVCTLQTAVHLLTIMVQADASFASESAPLNRCRLAIYCPNIEKER